MRFVAQAFVKLMEKFTFLEAIAFIVIGVLGIKLTSSLYTHFYPETDLAHAIEGEHTDMLVSIFTVAIFVLPVLSSILFNFPKKNIMEPEVAEAAEDVLDKS
jgi:predicted tellurium resistance membrane protein TerC